MIDLHVGRRYEHGLGVSKGIVPILTIVISDAGVSHSSVRHGLNEQENIGLIYRASSKGKGLQDAVDCFLVLTEHIAGKRFRERLDFCEQRAEVGIGEDG